MKEKSKYIPPLVWKWTNQDAGEFTKINRPISGKTHEKTLPVGDHPLQLYSLGTPNGVKVTILLEELLHLGYSEAEYDAWLIRLNGMQFGSGFVGINPNSKIPALVDYSGNKPLRVFESGAILLYLAERFESFIPKNFDERPEFLSWLFWQMASAPYLGGGFGHFYTYAPEKFEYPIDRYAMEVKRQLDVLDKNLADRTYICGEEYNIADIAIWPWYGQLVLGKLYKAGQFLEVETYSNVLRWAKKIQERPAVKRGRIVNRTSGPLNKQLRERHHSSDFCTKTQDKIEKET